MPILKEKNGKPKGVTIWKTWIEIPTEKGVSTYLVSSEVAEYIEKLEKQLTNT
jgi:hypothetical protein